MYVNSNCVGCGLCIDECNFAAISLSDGKAIIDQALCSACGMCAQICPLDAIEYDQDNLRPAKENQSRKNHPGSGSTETITKEKVAAASFIKATELGRCSGRGMGSRKGAGFGIGLARSGSTGNGRRSGKGTGSGKGMGSGKGRNR